MGAYPEVGKSVLHPANYGPTTEHPHASNRTGRTVPPRGKRSFPRLRSSKAKSCWTEPLGFIEELWGTATWQYSRDNACRAYHRGGALAYLAAYDVHRAKIYGRCDATTGIEPFTALVAQVMTQEPYAFADRVFWVVDNGSSHRGQ